MTDYAVAVQNSKWPTMEVLQECIDRHRWPVKLGDESHPRWTKPLAKAEHTLGMPVVFKGESIELEASFSSLGLERSHHDVNRTLASMGATNIRFEEGDQLLALTFRSNIKERQAGFYVMAALIVCFEGYGFNDADLSHGTSSYADALIAEATAPKPTERTPMRTDAIRDNPHAKSFLDWIRRPR